MSSPRHRKALAVAVLATAAAGTLVAAWSWRVPPRRAQPGAQAPAPPSLPRPDAPSVREALARVFAGAVVIPESEPTAVAGDFNGDGTADVAVVVVPNPARLGDVHDAYANWKVADVLLLADRHLGPTIVTGGERVLAVVHGEGRSGWRAARARQGYLLKNAVPASLRAQSWQALVAEAGASGELPRILGDVIRGRRGEENGLLYWTGAHYHWRRAPQ